MGDSFSKVVALLLALLLLFIYPVKNEFERLDETSRILVLTETSKFVDSVRNLGYITPAMYREYVGRLAATDNVYEIRLEHRKKMFFPEYVDPTAGVTPAAIEAPVSYVVGYRAFYNDTIMEVVSPDPPAVPANYGFEKGDYFAVTVYNKNKTIATRLQEMLYNTSIATEKIYVRYGGMIKDENN